MYKPLKNLRLLQRWLCAVVLVLCAVLGFFAWQDFYPVQSAEGWSYHVAYQNVEKAASIVSLHGGSLMVSQELSNKQGSIVRIDANGSREDILTKLSKPDGMIAVRGGYVFSQEAEGAMVSFLKDGKIVDLFKGSDVQGLFNDGKYLYAIEDRKGTGRLLRYRWSDRTLKVLRNRLSETESVTRCNGGRLLYTEKESGVVRELTKDHRDPVVLANLNKPTFLMCDDRGLWISEDSTHRARLLLIDPSGQRHTILSFLKAPQSIARTAKGTYLLAEGGRDRILELVPPQILKVGPM